MNFTNKLECENVWILCHIYTHSKDNENIYITMLNEKKINAKLQTQYLLVIWKHELEGINPKC